MRVHAASVSALSALSLLSLYHAPGLRELASKSDVRCVQNRPIKPNAFAPLLSA